MLTIKDRDKFINDGPFFAEHPDIYPDVVRYERLNEKDKIIESWERDDNGHMVETTKRDKLREEIIAAQEEISKLEEIV